jgi:23S rRNA (guanosine2251-2'-O)-methyltransferase
MDYIFGIRPVIEAIKANKEVDKVLLQKGLTGETYKELLDLLRERNISMQYVPYQKMDRITKKLHQGVIAYISLIEYQKLENVLPMIYESGEDPFLLILDQISDVRNMGAIVRTAECAGIHAIIVPSKGSAQINADAAKTSVGAIHRVPICRSDNLKKEIDFLKQSGIKIIAATEKAEEMYTKTDCNQPIAIIMGSEEKGISYELLKMAEEKVKIPLKGEIGSLNVSVATAVIVYEALRQKK